MSRATCENCLYEFNAASDLAGKRIRCPECGVLIVVGAKPRATLPPRLGTRDKSGDEEAKRLIILGAGAGLAVGLLIAVAMFFRGGNDGAVVPPPVAINSSDGTPEPAPPIEIEGNEAESEPTAHAEPDTATAPRRLVGELVPAPDDFVNVTRQTFAPPSAIISSSDGQDELSNDATEAETARNEI